MATVLPGPPSGAVPLLDLSFLTEEEKMVILRVLKADEDLRKVEQGEQQRVIEQERRTQKELSDNKQCSCCGKSFERDEGATCPECKYPVCPQCQQKMEGVPGSFCSICSKERMVRLQSLDYMPVFCTSDPTPSLYGSELLRRSLEAPTSTSKGTEEDAVTAPSPVVNTLLDEPTENAFNGMTSSTPDPHSTIVHHSESIGSLSSVDSSYSQTRQQRDYSIKGKLNVGVCYERNEEQLLVRINHANGLSSVEENGTSSPYIKVVLLPDKRRLTKRKTAIQKNTLNPVYNETLKYELLQTDMGSRTLWLSVWNQDECGSSNFLGEVRLPLISTDLKDFTDHDYNLQEMDVIEEEIDHENCGKLNLGLKFVPNSSTEYDLARTTGTVHITVKQAKGLASKRPQSETNSFVSCYLLPNSSQRSTKKTSVVNNNLNPTWQEEFTYNDVGLKELQSEQVLEVTVWSKDQLGADEFIGGIRVGPNPNRVRTPEHWMDSKDREISQWEAMLSNPGEWVEEWHMLRPSMNHLADHAAVPLSPDRSRAHLKATQAKGISPEEKHSDETADIITPLAPPSHNSTITAKGKDPPTNHRSQSLGNTLPMNAPRRSGSLQPISTRRPPTSSKMKRADSVSSVGSLTSLSRRTRGDYDITGDILLGIEYKRKQLLIHVKKAKGLASPDTKGSINSYVKIYLLPDRSKHSKRKTDVKKKTFNPVYSETLKYQVPREELTTRVIWLTVWDHDSFSTSRFLGELCLSPSSLNLSDSTPQWYKLQDYAEPARVPPSTRTSSSSKPLARGAASPLKTADPRKTLLREEIPVEVKRSRAATTPLRAVTQPTQQRRLLAEEMPANAKELRILKEPISRANVNLKDDPSTAKLKSQPPGKQQLVQKRASVTGSDIRSTEYLRGFETFAETSFIVAQGCSRSFEWQGCGLKLHIPEGLVPAEHTECRIDARAGFSGQFTFPDDSQLVSCVYWLSCSHKFLTPVTLEIQHCTSLHDPSRFSSLQFVAAKSSEPELPYQFRALDKGTFSPHSTYGSIQVSQFSFFGIISDKVYQRSRCYCGHLYYTRKGSNKWHVDFVITWNLPAYLKAVQGTHSSSAAPADLQFEVQFEGDSISLELPEDGVVLQNGWTIRPLGPLAITKQQIDEFNPGKQAPCCRLQVKLRDDARPAELEHKVKLLGAKTGFNFFTVACTPEGGASPTVVPPPGSSTAQ